jgi:hypothetical protein
MGMFSGRCRALRRSAPSRCRARTCVPHAAATNNKDHYANSILQGPALTATFALTMRRRQLTSSPSKSMRLEGGRICCPYPPPGSA